MLIVFTVIATTNDDVRQRHCLYEKQINPMKYSLLEHMSLVMTMRQT